MSHANTPRDWVRRAPQHGAVERIEAYFAGHGYDPHRHDTYAIGQTLAGVQSFRYRRSQRHSLPGGCLVLHPDELHDGEAGSQEGFRYRMLYVEPALIQQALGGRPLPFVRGGLSDDPRLIAASRTLLQAMDTPLEPLEEQDALFELAHALDAVAGNRARGRRHFDFVAAERARHEGLHLIPAFHPWLVAGVASYSLELFAALADLDEVYVPIGMGSGICGLIAARDALGLKTRIVGVVSAHAPAYALSFEAGTAISHPVDTRLADGMACSTPDPSALEMILAGADRLVRVSDREIGAAMRLCFTSTHNVAEGAGVAALAAAWQERERLKGAGQQRQVLHAVGMDSHQPLAETARRVAAIGGEGVHRHPPAEYQQAALADQQEDQQQGPGDQAEQADRARAEKHG